MCCVQGPPSFLVFRCRFYLGQFPNKNSDCLGSGDRGSEISCPTMRLPKKSCKKGAEASNPFHSLQLQQRTESKILINFPSKHTSLRVSRRQNSIKSSRRDSYFTLRRGCLSEKMELNAAALVTSKIRLHNYFSRYCPRKTILWRKPRIFMQRMWVINPPNSTLLVLNISTQVYSFLFGTKLPNTRTSVRTEPKSQLSILHSCSCTLDLKLMEILDSKSRNFSTDVFDTSLS